jgi:hypothetical protein
MLASVVVARLSTVENDHPERESGESTASSPRKR